MLFFWYVHDCLHAFRLFIRKREIKIRKLKNVSGFSNVYVSFIFALLAVAMMVLQPWYACGVCRKYSIATKLIWADCFSVVWFVYHCSVIAVTMCAGQWSCLLFYDANAVMCNLAQLSVVSQNICFLADVDAVTMFDESNTFSHPIDAKSISSEWTKTNFVLKSN